MKSLIYILMGLAGFILAIGTIGAADLNNISFTQLLVRSLIAVVLVGVAFFGVNLEEKREANRRRRRRKKYTKSGIPDILACVNGYFVAIEVKAQNGTVKALQEHHLTEIRIAGGFSFALYPSGFEKFKEFIKGLKKDTFNRELPLILK